MADDPKPGPYDPDPNLPLAPELRQGRRYNEAELAALARSVVARRNGPGEKPPTQEEIAKAFGVSQSVVSQALGYSREKNRQRGHALRRRILREWDPSRRGLSFAGPFWIATDAEGIGEPGRGDRPAQNVADRFAVTGENPYPHGNGTAD